MVAAREAALRRVPERRAHRAVSPALNEDAARAEVPHEADVMIQFIQKSMRKQVSCLSLQHIDYGPGGCLLAGAQAD